MGVIEFEKWVEIWERRFVFFLDLVIILIKEVWVYEVGGGLF